MKKITLFVAAVAMVATFASCKKEYACDCTVAGSTTSTSYGKLNKKDSEAAKTSCNNANSAAAIVGGSCKFVTK